MLTPNTSQNAPVWRTAEDLTHRSDLNPAFSQARNGSFEVLRLAGAFGIVLFHVGGPGASLGYAALPVFILMSLQFQLQAEVQGAGGVGARMRRFLVPFVAWSAIYAVARSLEAVTSGAPVFGWMQGGMILTGPALHLWFLPFMAVWSAVFCLFHTQIRALSSRQVSAIFALIALPCFFWLNTVEPGWGVAQWVFGLPVILLAPLFVNLDRPDNAIALVLWYTALFCAAMGGLTNGPLQLGIALVAVLVANSVVVALPGWLAHAAGLSLGIYLIHPLFAALFARVPVGIEAHSVGEAVLIFAFSGLAIAALRLIPLGRKIT